MANLITVGRLFLLFVVIWFIYHGSVQVIETCMLFIILVFASDGLDGWVARKRGSTSAFGAVFDIAATGWWKTPSGSSLPISTLSPSGSHSW